MNISTISTRLHDALRDYQFSDGYVVSDKKHIKIILEYAYVRVMYTGPETDNGWNYTFEVHNHYDDGGNKLKRLMGKDHKIAKVVMHKAREGREKVYDRSEHTMRAEPWKIPVYEEMHEHFDVVTGYNPYERIARLDNGW